MKKHKDKDKISKEESLKKILNHYGVIIYYKEPLFCRTIGKDPQTIFTALFHIEAENAEIANEKAHKEFKTLASLSSVHWERRIIKSEVKLQKF